MLFVRILGSVRVFVFPINKGCMKNNCSPLESGEVIDFHAPCDILIIDSHTIFGSNSHFNNPGFV